MKGPGLGPSDENSHAVRYECELNVEYGGFVVQCCC